MLAAVIEAAGGDVEGWRELTAHASDEGIYRDYCAMFLLYAAEHMDATEFTMGFAPYLLGGRTDENWDAFGTDIRGGYRLFEEFGENWDRVCVSVSSQMEDGQEMNYLNASQNFVVSRLSLITGEPLLDFDYGTFTMHLTEPLTYEDGAVAAVRLFESLPEDCRPASRRIRRSPPGRRSCSRRAGTGGTPILATETAIVKERHICARRDLYRAQPTTSPTTGTTAQCRHSAPRPPGPPLTG